MDLAPSPPPPPSPPSSSAQKIPGEAQLKSLHGGKQLDQAKAIMAHLASQPPHVRHLVWFARRICGSGPLAALGVPHNDVTHQYCWWVHLFVATRDQSIRPYITGLPPQYFKLLDVEHVSTLSPLNSEQCHLFCLRAAWLRQNPSTKDSFPITYGLQYPDNEQLPVGRFLLQPVWHTRTDSIGEDHFWKSNGAVIVLSTDGIEQVPAALVPTHFPPPMPPVDWTAGVSPNAVFPQEPGSSTPYQPCESVADYHSPESFTATSSSTTTITTTTSTTTSSTTPATTATSTATADNLQGTSTAPASTEPERVIHSTGARVSLRYSIIDAQSDIGVVEIAKQKQKTKSNKPKSKSKAVVSLPPAQHVTVYPQRTTSCPPVMNTTTTTTTTTTTPSTATSTSTTTTTAASSLSSSGTTATVADTADIVSSSSSLSVDFLRTSTQDLSQPCQGPVLRMADSSFAYPVTPAAETFDDADASSVSSSDAIFFMLDDQGTAPGFAVVPFCSFGLTVHGLYNLDE